MGKLLGSLGKGLGICGVEAINNKDGSQSNPFPHPHQLAINPAGFDSAVGQPLLHQPLVAGDLSVAVVANALLLVEPPTPSVALGLDAMVGVVAIPRGNRRPNWPCRMIFEKRGFHFAYFKGWESEVKKNLLFLCASPSQHQAPCRHKPRHLPPSSLGA